jgi:RNA polymerase subunit RPABC4/transcription elongation factor Spt4
MFNADGETISCPYCGFTELGDYWEEMAMRNACEETKEKI